MSGGWILNDNKVYIMPRDPNIETTGKNGEK